MKAPIPIGAFPNHNASGPGFSHNDWVKAHSKRLTAGTNTLGPSSSGYRQRHALLLFRKLDKLPASAREGVERDAKEFAALRREHKP